MPSQGSIHVSGEQVALDEARILRLIAEFLETLASSSRTEMVERLEQAIQPLRSLPPAPEPSPVLSARQSSPAPAAAPIRTALVVDPDLDRCTALAKLLGAGGTEVALAFSCQQAMEQVGARPFDLVAVELFMSEPGGTRSGLELLASIRAARPSQCVVIITDHDSREMAVDAIRLGASEYVVRGPTFTLARVQEAIAGRPSMALRPVLRRKGTLAQVEYERVADALAQRGGNISQAARDLGIERRSLQRKIEKNPLIKRLLRGRVPFDVEIERARLPAGVAQHV